MNGAIWNREVNGKTVWQHLVEIYTHVERYESENRIDNINGTPFRITNQGFYIPAWLGLVRDSLERAGYGEGQTLIDLGVGDSRFLMVGRQMGGKESEQKGPESDIVMYNLSCNIFDESHYKRGLDTPDLQDIALGKDIMKYPIGDGDVVCAYVREEMQIPVVDKFYAFAKHKARLVMFNASEKTQDRIHQMSIDAPVIGSRNDPTIIAVKQ